MWENLKEMNKLIHVYDLSKLNQESKKHIKHTYEMKKIEALIKSQGCSVRVVLHSTKL